MSFFRRKSLFIILLGIILMVVLIGYSLTNKDDLSKTEKFIKDSVGWVQGVVYKPVDLIAGSLSSIKELKATYEENQLLREKNSEYKTLVYDNQSLEKENEELRETLDLNESNRDFNSINARSEEHTSELQSRGHLVCRLLLEKKKTLSKKEV